MGAGGKAQSGGGGGGGGGGVGGLLGHEGHGQKKKRAVPAAIQTQRHQTWLSLS